MPRGGAQQDFEQMDQLREPPMFRVLLHNDDYTPMEFVVHVLASVFGKSEGEAVSIMLNVHQKGMGLCGAYPYEIAETKVAQVGAMARKDKHPLKCTMEED